MFGGTWKAVSLWVWRLRAPAALTLLVLPHAACAPNPPDDIVSFPGGPPASSPVAGYTLHTPIEVIAADPAGAAVLNKDIPGLLTDSRYETFKGMSLSFIALFSNGRLSDETLAQTQADLAKVKKQAQK